MALDTLPAPPAPPVEDEYTGKLEKLITTEELRPFTRISAVRGVFWMVVDWATIVGTAWACERWWHPLLYVVAVIVIGSRQHALGVIAHDAAHYTLFKSRRLNDWVGEILLAWPVLVSLRFYRRQHLAHHAHLATDRDPDQVRNRPDLLEHQRTWLDALLLMCGRGTKQAGLASMFLGSPARPGDRRWIAGRVVVCLAAAAAITWMGWWRLVALYWIVPLFTWFVLVMRLRGVLEHWGVPNKTPLDMTRTVKASPLEGFFLLPHRIHLHIEHHHYPRVPHYRLMALHRRLLEVPVFRERAEIANGVPAALRDIFRFPARRRSGTV